VIRELALGTLLLLMTSSLGIDVAQAQPSPPATFAGTVRVDGQDVPDGTPVLALINGKLCGESSREPGQKGTWTVDSDIADLGIHVGDSIYIVDVASDSQTPGCGTEGAIVTFQVAGQPVRENGLWKAGFNPLSLTVGQAPAPAATPQGQAPAVSQEASGDDFPWWPAAAGASAAVVIIGLLAAAWRRRATARRQA
jgi:hypothetical protein